MKQVYKLPKTTEFRSISNPRRSPAGKRTVFVKKFVGGETERKLGPDHELYSSDPEQNPLKKEEFFTQFKDKQFGMIKKTTSSGYGQRQKELQHISAGVDSCIPHILKYNKSTVQMDSRPGLVPINPYQTKLLKKQLRAFDSFIPTQHLDFDRLNEEKEDFLSLDKKRGISKDIQAKLSPDPMGLQRNIVGSKQIFEEGKQIKLKQELAQNKGKRKTKDNHSNFSRQASLSNFNPKNIGYGSQSRQVSNNGIDLHSRDTSPSKRAHQIPISDISRNTQAAANGSQRASQPTIEGVEIIQADQHLDKTKQTRYMKNSDRFQDNDIDKYIQNLKNQGNVIEMKQSVSKRNIEQKHEKMLQNYDNYQMIWMKNLDRTKLERNKLNDREVSQNYKTNINHSITTGDLVTIQDRADSSLMKNQYKNILEHAFEVNKLQTTHKDNINWYCSLRQNEHDHQFDGIVPLKKKKGNISDTQYGSVVTLKTSRGENENNESHRSLSFMNQTQISSATSINFLNTLNQKKGFSSSSKKMNFEKHKKVFDQVFINDEEDKPLQNRRVNPTYTAGNGLGFADTKFIMHQRIPRIRPQVVMKPGIFSTRQYATMKKNQNLMNNLTQSKQIENFSDIAFKNEESIDIKKSNLNDESYHNPASSTALFEHCSTMQNDLSTDRFLSQTPGFIDMEKHKKIVDIRLKGNYMNKEDVQNILPCSLDAFESELFLLGESKLQKEIQHALRIPEIERRIIRKEYLEGVVSGQDDEIIAKHIDPKQHFFI